MSDFLQTLKNVGVHAHKDFSTRRKVQMANILFSLTSVYTLILSIAFLIIERDLKTIVFTAFLSLTFSLSVFYNKQGWFSLSRHNFLATIIIGVWSSAFLNGENFRAEIIFLPAIAIPYVLYLRKELRLAIAWSAVFVMSYFIMSFWYEKISPFDPITVEEAIVLNKVLFVLLFLWMINIVFVFSLDQKGQDSKAKQSELNQSKLSLEVLEKNEKISLLEDLLIRKEKEIIKAKNKSETDQYRGRDCELFKSVLSADFSDVLQHQKKSKEEGEQLIKNLSVLHGESSIKEFKSVSFITDIESRISFLIKGLRTNTVAIYFDNELTEGQLVKTDGFTLSYVLENILKKIIATAKEGELFLKLKKGNDGKAFVALNSEGEITLDFLSKDARIVQLQNDFSTKLRFDGNQIVTIEFDIIGIKQKELNQVQDQSSKIRVLLVDDVDINLQLASVLLESLGCVVTQAATGEKVFELYEKGKFDLILMDINLPGLNGDEVMLQLKEKQEVDALIVALSANAIVGDKEKYLAKGFDEYLTKPITIQKLTQCLGGWFPAEKSTLFKAEANFLLDLSQIEQTANLLGGWSVYFTFIDRFLEENNSICAEIEKAYLQKDLKAVELLLHKLGGIASSVGAIGYFEVLHSGYEALRAGRGIAEEELEMLLDIAKETNTKLTNLKTIKS